MVMSFDLGGDVSDSGIMVGLSVWVGEGTSFRMLVGLVDEGSLACKMALFLPI